ncbi:hypothetical protein [Halomonas ramblicola]|uniref:hypothetical protein n=1 Tax=Halomonas ramblicola TaxID=747349 RepID=UPI0025B3C63F|nr:hypothetical protein [Halomonas ramblicola]MDN3520020.1 hypothetical protein [Halomonas ramblicola]
MDDPNFEQFVAECEAADDYWEEMRLLAKRSEMPQDPAYWLDKQEAELPGALERAPESVASEFGPLITGQIQGCRRWLQRGDEENAKILFVVLAENIERLKHNLSLHTSAPIREGARKGGNEKNRNYQQQRGAYQPYIEDLSERRPDFSYAELQRQAARHFGCSPDTIKRHTRNPRKK